MHHNGVGGGVKGEDPKGEAEISRNEKGLRQTAPHGMVKWEKNQVRRTSFTTIDVHYQT